MTSFVLFGFVCFSVGVFVTWRYKDSFLNWVREVF